LQQIKPLIINGWTLYAHPLFLNQYNSLLEQVKALKQKDPEGYQKKNATKRLAAIKKLAFEVIPQNPALAEYRQGNTLGQVYKHWFRAKFFQQYRLFFRYHQKSKIIVLAWVNDTQSKRAYGSKKDACKVFEKMLKNGHPPDSWENLLNEVKNVS